jgi:hypothetical protein
MHIVQTDSRLIADLPYTAAFYNRAGTRNATQYAIILAGDHTDLLAFTWCRMFLPIQVVQNALAFAFSFRTDEDMLAEVPLSLGMMVANILWAQNLQICNYNYSALMT